MFGKRSFKRRLPYTALVLVLVLVLCFTPGLTTGISKAADEPVFDGDPVTQFQTQLYEAIQQRYASGLPVPSVTFSNQMLDPMTGLSTFSASQAFALADERTVTVATTILYFDGPKEAGYDEWPAVEAHGNIAGDASNSFSTGDLTEAIRLGVENQDPDFWQQTTFGQEAREYTITETIELSAPPVTPLLGINPFGTTVLQETAEDILMGFTYTGPNIDYTIEQQAKSCFWFFGRHCIEWFYFKAGFQLDWGLGLRLPGNVTLSQVQEGTDTYFETSLTPQDWDEGQYSAYGVAAEGGNEFVLQLEFFAGIIIRTFGTNICPSCSVNISEDYSTSFTTPFGENSSFPISPITIPVYEISLAGAINATLNFVIQPQLTSTDIRANWVATAGDTCSQKGTVLYKPNEPFKIQPTDTCFTDNPDPINMQVSNFQYYFNTFKLGFGAGVSYSVLGLWSGNYTKTVFTLNLSDITKQLGLFVGDHVQCDWKFTCGRIGPDNILVLGAISIDTTPPIITPTVTGTNGQNGWYISDVSLTWEITDNESAIDPDSIIGCLTTTITEDQGENEYACQATSLGGTTQMSVTIKRDATPPVITCPMEGPFLLNSGDHVIGPPLVEDLLSGAVADNTQVGTVTTESAGPKILTFTAFDQAGNSASQDCSYDVYYAFHGFLPPVATMNTGNAGRVYPIKWQLMDANLAYFGDLSAIASITYSSSNMCNSSEVANNYLEPSTPGETTWRYDLTDQQYVFNWKSPSIKGCYAIELTLDSGQVETAYFSLK